jgi:hypothetical protein
VVGVNTTGTSPARSATNALRIVGDRSCSGQCRSRSARPRTGPGDAVGNDRFPLGLRCIKSGELKSGARLPPERDLARGCGVADDTVQRLRCCFRERGLIANVQTGHLRGLTSGADTNHPKI